jgi:hypothetical protein
LLTIDGAAQAIEFYKRTFGATERLRMPMPDGRIAHAELEIGDSVVMLNDPFPQSPLKSPKELGGTAVSVFLYVEDGDSVVQDAGARRRALPADEWHVLLRKAWVFAKRSGRRGKVRRITSSWSWMVSPSASLRLRGRLLITD